MANFARIACYLAAGLRRLHWKSNRLKEYQDRRVRAVVRHAYDSVPFYHDRFKRHGVSPEDIKTVEDLDKLPVFSKDDFRSVSVSSLISMKHNIARLKRLRTSGSSGKPFNVFVNSVEDDWRKAIYLRANISCGQRPRDSWAFVTAPRHFDDTTSIQRRIGVFAQKLIPVFAQPSRQLQLVRDVDPDILDGYSGALFLIAKEAEKLGVNDVRPRIVFGSSDSIDLPSRKFIEKVFLSPYLDQYGCSEVNRVAWQCPQQLGYHMDVDSVVTQFVDAEGSDVGRGEQGEIVLTSLYNFAMPLIRYSMGDIGRLSPETCSCWRTFPLMYSVEGRRDSFIVLPDGQLISPRVLTVALSTSRFYNSVEQFRIVQKRRDFFEVYLKMNSEIVDKELVAEDLKAILTSALNAGEFNLFFNVKFVDDIPLSKTGRLSAVSSEVS
jgi:phenylacetate-CoA ligase